MGEFSFSVAPESTVKVFVQEGILKACGPQVADSVKGRKALVITHPVVADLFLDTLQDSLEQAGFTVHAMCLPEGESSKDWDTLTDIFEELRAHAFDRSDVVISLGGGVAGDIATVVAGLYMRGINLVHIPTTLLAQVDSCLGGKGAVNFGPGKNMLGLFYHPRLIIVDPLLLNTLPEEQLAAGYAELAKTVLLAGESFLVPGAWCLEGRAAEDTNGKTALAVSTRNKEQGTRLDFSVPFSQFLQFARNQEPGTRNDFTPSMSQLVASCLAFKAAVVAGDPLDVGSRQQLNLGHTFAHALEAVGGYSEYNHGQAVGLGLLAALRLSQVRYGLERKVEDEVRRLLDDLGLPTCTTYGYEDMQPYFKADKKSAAGMPRFVGLRAVGEYAMIEDASEDELRQALQAILCQTL